MELRTCLGVVEEHINEEAEYAVSDQDAVSDQEIEHFRMMIEDIVGFLQDQELLDENGELDEGTLDWICEKMKEGEYD